MKTDPARTWIGLGIAVAAVVVVLGYFLLRERGPGAMYVFKGERLRLLRHSINSTG